MKTIVTGVLDTEDVGREAIRSLVSAGAEKSDISFIHLEETPYEKANSVRKFKKAGKVVMGSALGVVAGIVVVSGVLPALGTVFAAGPLAVELGLANTSAVLAGAAAGAVGGLVGTLSAFGIAREDAEYYAGRVQDGEVLLIVETKNEEEVDGVKRILRDHHADEVRAYHP